MSSRIKLKQITGSISGSLLFVGTNNSVTEDYSKLNWNITDSILSIDGKLKISDGSENLGYVLTSDENGLATWTDQNSYEVPISGIQNGINKEFTIAYPLANESRSLFYINGVLYDKSFYTIIGTSLIINTPFGIDYEDELKLYSNITAINSNNSISADHTHSISDVIGLQDELNNADLYLNFTESVTFDFFIPYNMKITSVEKSNSALITIKVNNLAYTLDTAINKFDTLTIESSSASNVIVKGVRI
jgi:hypothetical protein